MYISTNSQATNHIINYDVVRLPTEHKETVKPGDIIINTVSPDFADVIEIDAENRSETLGYYMSKRKPILMIGIVEDRISSDEDFEQVILHELGHSVGLHHNKEFLTLMYPSIDLASDYITSTEIVNFCKLYKCDPSKLKAEDNNFRPDL